MMDNGKMPAMPMFSDNAEPCIVRDPDTGMTAPATGLTKREMMAMHFMPVIISKTVGTYNIKCYAQGAIELADALLAELENTSK